MMKFKCDEFPLEVIRCATFSQGYLNRQVIMLLNCLGVPDTVFRIQLGKALEGLNIKQVLKRLVNQAENFYKKKTSSNS